jgi:hypothetical protein
MSIATVKISRERPLEGLYQLLAASESLRPDRIACESSIGDLDDRIAEPLRGMIDQGLEWVAEIETTASANASLPAVERRAVAEACFDAQRELRRALRELGLSSCTIDEAIARCEAAAGRLRASLTRIVTAMGERALELTLEWRDPSRTTAKTMERSPVAMRKVSRFTHFREADGATAAEVLMHPRRLAAGTGTPEFRRVPPPPRHRPLIANAVIARCPESDDPPSVVCDPCTLQPAAQSLSMPSEPDAAPTQPYFCRSQGAETVVEAPPPPRTGAKAGSESRLEQLSRASRRKKARLRRRASESREG